MTEPQNPLLLPVVANVLLEHVPKRMWVTCRLVCKPWHDVLTLRWRKQMRVRIGGMGKSDLAPLDNDNKSFMDVLSFVSSYQPKDSRQLEKFPFRSVKTIPGEVTVGGSRREIKAQNGFWNLCGPWLHRLNFFGVMFKDVDMLKNIIFRLTPNLEQLEFNECDVPETMRSNIETNDPKALICYRPGHVQTNLKILKISLEANPNTCFFEGTFPISLLNVFSVFTNLEEVRLSCFVEMDESDELINYLLDVIKTVRSSYQNSVLNIKKLDIKRMDPNFTPGLATKLCALSLPLEELHIQIDAMEDGLQRILSKYPNLTKLGLLNDNDPPLNQSRFQLDTLPKALTELELTGFVFENWNFLTFTPHLVKLVVSHEWFQGRIPFPETFTGSRTPVLESLTTFCYDCGNVICVESVQMFTKIMPNVTKLTLSVNCAGFKHICNTWSGLTYWNITYAHVKEAAFVTNIKKLKQLACLKVNVAEKENNGREIMTGFGNNSIKKGFMKLPKLQRLCITLPHGITEKLLKDLYEKVEDTSEVYIVRDKYQCEKYTLQDVAENGRKNSISIMGGCYHRC